MTMKEATTFDSPRRRPSMVSARVRTSSGLSSTKRRKSEGHNKSNFLLSSRDKALRNNEWNEGIRTANSTPTLSVTSSNGTTENKSVADERKQVSYRHQMLLLKYLTQNQSYLKEGIFRVCGRSEAIKNAEMKLIQDKMTAKEIIQMFDEIGTYACADLLKTILRKRAEPLITPACLQGFNTARELQVSESWDLPHTPDEQVSLFLNSTFSLLPRQDSRLVRGVCEFLRLVVMYEEDSKMGLGNVSRIFSMLFFGAPTTTDPLMFVKESEQRTELLQFLLRLYSEQEDMFENSTPTIERLVAKSTVKQKPVCILRGETVNYFFSTDEYAYVQTSVHIFQVNLDTLHTSFKPENGSSIKNRRGRTKRKIQSDPISIAQSSRKRLSSINFNLPKPAASQFARRKSTVQDLIAFIRKGSVDCSG